MSNNRNVIDLYAARSDLKSVVNDKLPQLKLALEEAVDAVMGNMASSLVETVEASVKELDISDLELDAEEVVYELGAEAVIEAAVENVGLDNVLTIAMVHRSVEPKDLFVAFADNAVPNEFVSWLLSDDARAQTWINRIGKESRQKLVAALGGHNQSNEDLVRQQLADRLRQGALEVDRIVNSIIASVSTRKS